MGTKQEWEKAEIERSDQEALHTPAARLIADEQNVARYLDPPLETVYPLEYAYALIGDVRGRVVLDFGCGSGGNSLLLARRGAKVIGLDISHSLVTLARRRLETNGLAGRGRFIVGSAHDVPLLDGSVDLVLGVAVLHHLDLNAASREIHRVLKPDGRAIFQEPVRDSRVVRYIRRCIPYQAPDVSPFERPLTTPELTRFGARFRSMRCRPFTLPFVSVMKVGPWKKYVHAAYRIDGVLLNRFPWLSPLGSIRVMALTK
jgi:SAM-dependent methyltransferase